MCLSLLLSIIWTCFDTQVVFILKSLIPNVLRKVSQYCCMLTLRLSLLLPATDLQTCLPLFPLVNQCICTHSPKQNRFFPKVFVSKISLISKYTHIRELSNVWFTCLVASNDSNNILIRIRQHWNDYFFYNFPILLKYTLFGIRKNISIYKFYFSF